MRRLSEAGLASLAGTVAGGADVSGLAYDPGTDTLYAVTRTGSLLSTTPAAASFTVVATTWSLIEGLAFDTSKNALFGIDDAGDLLVRIDPATGATTAVRPGGSLGISNPRALTFNR